MSNLELKLTDYEVDALSRPFNFADGHARYTLTDKYRQVLETLPTLLLQEDQQEKIEADFSNAFFDLANQRESVDLQRLLYCPSASLSIEIVANYLRMHNLSVALIEPVFDNLADILKRHNVALYSLREDTLRSKGIKKYLEEVKTDALFLVIPNNPTGYVFSQPDFQYLVDFCVRNQRILILDFSFRFFSTEMISWNQYTLLNESGVRYITVEDTGKTWNTYELKVSPLTADMSIYPDLCSIYRDMFICSSPMALILTREFIKISQEEGFEQSVLSIPQRNRDLLRNTLLNTSLKPVSLPNGSVEWIFIENEMDDLEIVDRLIKLGLYALPGRHFFWSDPEHNSKFIRVALMRDTDMFARGVKFLEHMLPLVLDQN